MTTVVFTTNTGTSGENTLGIRANYDVVADVLTIDNVVLGLGGNDSLGSIQLPIIPNELPITFAITLDGGGGNDAITGYNKSDVLIGGFGDDVISGAPGCVMSGGSGTDTLNHNVSTVTPFTGNLKIVYSTQAAAATLLSDGSRISGFEKFLVVAGAGRDTLDLSGDAGANGSSFFGHTGNDTLTVDRATRGSIFFDGDIGADRVVANLAAATAAIVLNGAAAGGLTSAGLMVGCSNVESYLVTSGAGADSLTGGSGADALSAGNGNDLLSGGLGADKLTGGLGNDRFAFNSLDEGVDVITDFHNAVGDNDRLTFELLDVGALGAGAGGLGAIKAIHFQASSSAVALTADVRFIYDTDDGRLRYDEDGNGAAAAIVICNLTGAPTITATDIFIL